VDPMVANPGDSPAAERPPVQRKGTMGRRRRRWRESVLVWWGVFAALLVAAWLLWSWRVALLALLLWCLYEFVLVPTICRVTTRQGFSCREPVRGRLFACNPAHQQLKNDALWRLAGLHNPVRKKKVVPDPNRDTGVVVYSAAVRGRLAQADRAVLMLAGLGTLITIIGMLYGF
jgi:hypothetical protein